MITLLFDLMHSPLQFGFSGFTLDVKVRCTSRPGDDVESFCSIFTVGSYVDVMWAQKIRCTERTYVWNGRGVYRTREFVLCFGRMELI